MNMRVSLFEDTEEYFLKNIKTRHSKICNDERMKKLIVKTLFRLPKDVRKKVLREVYFIYSSCPGVSTAIDIKYFVGPMIILNFQKIRKKKRMDIITHEIAHFILNHYGNEKISKENKERDADNLTEKWGFKKAYTEKQYKEIERKIF